MIQEFYYGSSWHWPLPYLPKVMLSYNMIRTRKKPWDIQIPFMMDSGAFAVILNYKTYFWTVETYAKAIELWKPDVAWTMDYPCEPSVRREGSYSSYEAQEKTNANTARLMELGIDVSNVVQGWTLDEYVRNLDQIKANGLMTERLAIGSICRRGKTQQIARIIREIKRNTPGWVKLHGFGVKTSILETDAKHNLFSADSQSWDIEKRHYSWTKNNNKGLIWKDKVPMLQEYVEKIEAYLNPPETTLIHFMEVEA